MNRLERLTDAKLLDLLERTALMSAEGQAAREEWARRFVRSQRRTPEIRRTYYRNEP